MRNSKIILKIFKNILFKTTEQILTKFGTKHPWVDVIEIFTNKDPRPFLRRDNSKLLKIYGNYFKNFYFRTTGPVSTKRGIKHPWVEEIQIFFSNREPCLSTKGDNNFFYWKHVKISLRWGVWPIDSCYDLRLSRLGFEHSTFRLKGERSYPLRHRRG